MKTPRFSGPFRWSALGQQLLSLREDVQSIQKIAGRNVTIDEYPGKGTIINVSRSRQEAPAVGGCENTKDVIFSGVSIRSDCLGPDFCFAGEPSIVLSEVSFNGTTTTLDHIGTTLTDYCDPNLPPLDCAWQNLSSAVVCHRDSYRNDDCTDLMSESDILAQILVGKNGATWYALVEASFTGTNMGLLFYGTGTTTTISNSLSSYSSTCGDTIQSSPLLDIWYGDCTAGSGDQTYTIIGSGGTATIS